jgi:uncharacterized protein (TIGR00730 family)
MTTQDHEALRIHLDQLLSEFSNDRDRSLAEDLLSEAVGLLIDQPHSLDLKIATATITEMRDAFAMFSPYRGVRKASIFGSARTQPHDPLWEHTRRLAARLAQDGWMVITGAGPGIMQAGMEGAGRERSIGVSIRLPFEQGANPVIAGDEKYVSMRYFFTRKLMLVKESSAFICLPGGFGTLDETFELLTLTQTGKGLPVPIVFLDTPGDRYWEMVDEFVREQLITRQFVSPEDVGFYFITDSCQAAVAEIDRFYANYDSIRFIGKQLVLRLRHEPSDAQLEALNAEFADLVQSGGITRVKPHPVEIRQGDKPDLPRISFTFARHRYGDLRALINRCNSFVEA